MANPQANPIVVHDVRAGSDVDSVRATNPQARADALAQLQDKYPYGSDRVRRDNHAAEQRAKPEEWKVGRKETIDVDGKRRIVIKKVVRDTYTVEQYNISDNRLLYKTWQWDDGKGSRHRIEVNTLEGKQTDTWEGPRFDDKPSRWEQDIWVAKEDNKILRPQQSEIPQSDYVNEWDRDGNQVKGYPRGTQTVTGNRTTTSNQSPGPAPSHKREEASINPVGSTQRNRPGQPNIADDKIESRQQEWVEKSYGLEPGQRNGVCYPDGTVIVATKDKSDGSIRVTQYNGQGEVTAQDEDKILPDGTRQRSSKNYHSGKDSVQETPPEYRKTPDLPPGDSEAMQETGKRGAQKPADEAEESFPEKFRGASSGMKKLLRVAGPIITVIEGSENVEKMTDAGVPPEEATRIEAEAQFVVVLISGGGALIGGAIHPAVGAALGIMGAQAAGEWAEDHRNQEEAEYLKEHTKAKEQGASK